MHNILTFRVPERNRGRSAGIALIMAGNMFCVPAFMMGALLTVGFSPGILAFCVFAGYFILWAFGCLIGIQSSGTGLPSAVISAEGLGILGARFVTGLLLTITSVGWFGIQAAACGASFSVMSATVLGLSMPEWLSTIFWGLVMTFTVMYGFQALKFLNYIMAPVLLLILAYTLYSVLSSGGLTVLSAYRPASSMSLTTGMSLTVGSFAMGAFTTGDFCRYTKNPGGLILSLFIGIVIVGPVVILSGAVFRIAAGNGDITALLTGLGFPAGALIILIFATWTSNVVNAYSGSIAVSVLLGLEEKRFKLTAAITGSVGTILGAAGIFTRFLDFLSLLSSLVPPVAGVIIAAYLVRIIRNKRRENSGDQPNPPENNPGIHISHSGYGAGVLSFPPGFHLPGLAAYGLGALAAWFTGAMVPFFIPSVNGIIVAMAAYMVLEKIFIRRAGSKIAKSPWGARD